MAQIFVRQVRGMARLTGNKKRTLLALGLGKIGKTKLHKDNRALRGMIRNVIHQVEVKSV